MIVSVPVFSLRQERACYIACRIIAKRVGLHAHRIFFAITHRRLTQRRQPVEWIHQLYAVEREAKELGLGLPERHALRREKSLLVLDELDAWVDAHRESFLPKSPLGSATRYAFEQREYVRRCFSDGRFEIDNGRVEREMREVAIGRKNLPRIRVFARHRS